MRTQFLFSTLNKLNKARSDAPEEACCSQEEPFGGHQNYPMNSIRINTHPHPLAQRPCCVSRKFPFAAAFSSYRTDPISSVDVQTKAYQRQNIRNPMTFSRRNQNNQIFRLIIHIKATFNNTILTLTNLKGQVITWASAGSCGFKGARKGTPFAAKKVVEIFIRKSNDYFLRCDQIKIYVSGVGPGRENAIRGLAAISKTIKQNKPMNKGGSKAQLSNKIVLIREMTKMPHNGCRPTKKRRI